MVDMCCLLVQMWYSAQMKMICEWLSDRLDIALHPYQLTCLSNIVRVSSHVYNVADVFMYCPHYAICTYDTKSSRNTTCPGSPVAGNNVTLHCIIVLHLQLSLPPPSSLAPIKSKSVKILVLANPGPPGKWPFN